MHLALHLGYCGPLSGKNYACDYGQGTMEALLASILLVIGLTVSCCTPKSTPLLRLIRKQDRKTEFDPCCCGTPGESLAYDEGDGTGYDEFHHCCLQCCKGRSKYKIYKENPELILRQLPADEVEVDGRTFPHYWDDQAGGITLQSQYTAACQRYLECEKNYQNTLDRFKQECDYNEDGAGDYSELLKKQSHSYWRQILKMPLEKIEDPEQARLVRVLDTLNGNCQQAKLVMDRIESDLAELMKPPEQKIEEALCKLEEEEEVKKQKNAGKNIWWAKGTKKFLSTSDSPQKEESPQNGMEAILLQASSFQETSYQQSINGDLMAGSMSSNVSSRTMKGRERLSRDTSAREEMAFFSARMESLEVDCPQTTSSGSSTKKVRKQQKVQ